MKSRPDMVMEQDTESFLDLPGDIKHYIPSVAPNSDATKIKRTLSKTCKSLHSFFQQSLDMSDAQRLLSHVLQGNAKEAKSMYTANPRLLFIEATAQEYAAGIDDQGEAVHRSVTESPFIAAARAGDVWLLKEMKGQFGKILDQRSHKSGHLLAEEQLADAFPDGFAYPPSTYNFNDLVQAITHDLVLRNARHFINPGQASPDTEKILAQFRKDFLPNSKKVGYHSNLNDLIKALEIYTSCCNKWRGYQAMVFWSQVVGYFERLVSACDAQALSQGIMNVKAVLSLERRFDIDLYMINSIKKISYFPLDAEPSYRLGGSFAVNDKGQAVRMEGGWPAKPEALARLLKAVKNYVNLKQKGLEEFKLQLHSSVDQPKVSQAV